MSSRHEFGRGDRVGDLVIERLLGRGGFGSVYLARDPAGASVAVKVLASDDGGTSESQGRAFLRETEAIGRVESENIVRLRRAHRPADRTWMIEMEFVDGGTLRDLLVPGQPVPGERARRIVRGLLSGLDAAHRAHVLHRDVKPENVLVTRDGTAKLADFGLARIIGQDSMIVRAPRSLVGTPAYLSPETLLGRPASVQTDLWSVGVVIFEVLAGRVPFPQTDLQALFFALQNSVAPPLGADTDPVLADIAGRCLAKWPEDRPATAAELAEAIDRASSPIAVRPLDQTVPTVPRFVGRAHELSAVDGLLDRVWRGASAAMIVTGEAGIGRSAFVREARVRARARGFLWLYVTVGARTGLVSSIVEATRTAIGSVSSDDVLEHVTGRVPLAVETIARQLLHDAPTARHAEPEEILLAVAALLRGTAHGRPIAIAVDDVDPAAEDDVRALRELKRQMRSDRLLLVVAHRTAAGTTASPLGEPLDATLLRLSGLPAPLLVDVLQEHAGGAVLPAVVVSEIAQRSEGNPHLALELLRHLEQTGRIVLRDGRYVAASGDGAAMPSSLADLFEERLAGLDESAREFLSVAAVQGREFDAVVLATTAELSLLDVLRRLEALCRSTDVIDATETGYRFSHPLVHDTLYAGVEPARQSALHRVIAAELVRQRGDDELVGEHWQRAGDQSRARSPLVRAAAELSEVHGRTRALDLLDRSQLLDALDEADLVRAHVVDLLKLAVTLRDCGRSNDALRVYRAVEAVLAPADRRRRMYIDVQRALTRHGIGGLTDADEAVLRVATDELPVSKDLGVAHWVLGLVQKRRARLDEASRSFETADRVFQEAGLPRFHALALNARASIAADVGDFATAERLYGEAAELSRRLGREANAAISAVNQADVAMSRGALESTLPVLRDACRVLVVLRREHPADHARALLAELRFALGDVPAAEGLLDEAIESTRRREQLPTLARCLLLRAHVLTVRGALTEATEALNEVEDVGARLGGPLHAAGAAAERATIYVVTGRLAQARTCVESAVASIGAAPEDQAMLALHIAVLATLGFDASAVEIPTRGEGPFARLTATALSAACSVSSHCLESAPLHGAADSLEGDGIGPNRAELRVVGRWLRAEALRRDGRRDAAGAAGESALIAAATLEHVWLELAVLCWLLDVAPTSAHRTRYRRILGDAAARAGSAALAERVTQRWGRAD